MGTMYDNSIKPMSGGSTIPLRAYTNGVSTGYSDPNAEITHYYTETNPELKLYYRVENQNTDGLFVVTTGACLDITFAFNVSDASYVPKGASSISFDKYTEFYITNDDYSQKYSRSWKYEQYVSNIVIPGVLLNYEVTGQSCTVTYRYWLATNMAFTTGPVAKFTINNRINVGQYGGGIDTVYLHLSDMPYVVYPEVIYDERSFDIEYSFPDLPNIEYIQFELFDEAGGKLINSRDISRTSNYYTFTWTDDDIAKLYSRYNTVNDAKVYFTVKYKRKDDANPMALSYPMTFTIFKQYPTMSVSWSDPKNLGGTGVFIEGKSDLRVVVNPVAYKGATIEYIAIYSGGQVYVDQKDVTFTTVTDKQFEVLCRDSRGNEYGTWYELSKWVPYIPPSCSIAAEAPNTDGYLPVAVSGIYFDSYKTYFNNSFNIYYKYTSSNPENSIEDWTVLTPKPTISVDSNYRYAISFTLLVPNHADTYTIQVQFSDKYTTYTTNSITVKALPVFDWGQEDFNFNVPVTIQGDLVVTGQIVNAQMAAAIEDTIPADYVVQTGKSGIWTYRLWNSGVAECWGRLLPTQYTINTAWGALYVKDNAILRQDYPFTFKELPVVSMSLYNTVGNCWAYTGTVGSTSQSPAYGLARGTSGSVTVGVELTAIGKWK